MTTSPPSGANVVAPLQTVRIIYGSLIAGAAMFALAAGLITEWGAEPLYAAESTPGLFTAVWAALALGSIPVVLFFRDRAAKAAGIDEPYRVDRPAGDPMAVQTALIIAWAAVEGAALFGIISFMMYGGTELLLGTVLAAAVGWGLGFPKSSYFEDARSA